MRPPAVPPVEVPVVDTPPAALHAPEGPVVVPDPTDPGRVVVTFRYRDSTAAGVLLVLNRVTDTTAPARTAMRLDAVSGWWHLSLRMPADWRASYGFLVAPEGTRPAWLDDLDVSVARRLFDTVVPDAANPRTIRNRAGVELSVVAGPEAPAQHWLDPQDGVRLGEVETTTSPSGRSLWVHRPPGAGPTGPLVLALDGDAWLDVPSLPTTVANLCADYLLRAPTVVGIGAGADRWGDHGPDGALAREVVEEIVPWAQRALGSGLDPEDVVVVGQSLGGLEALRLGLEHPDVVGVVVAQSPSLWRSDLDDLDPVPAGRLGLRVRLEIGTLEPVLRGPGEALVGRLRAAGVDVAEAPFVGGHDVACWAGGVAEALVWAIPDPDLDGED